jgi:flavin-dependent dehydrogenase
LGGGPAGACAAKLLASWGHSVHLITRPAVQRIAVSLPPSCAKLFDAIGVCGAIDGARFIRSTGNTVWWGTADARVETFAGGERGWQVDLATLESVLLEAAIAAGVKVDRRVITADWRQFDDAAFVVDCTGRSGIVARARNTRRYHDGPSTIALVAEWRGPFLELHDQSHTAIESYQDGWMWSVPIAAHARHVSAMIDPQRSDLAKGVSAREVYLREIAKTRAFKRLLSDATLIGAPSGWDASTYYSERYAGDGWLLVGDAGSAIDPLSSAGVKKALASAWLAAIAVNTSLRTAAMREHALQFFSDREREIEQHHVAASRAFLAAAARGHDRPFWDERSAEVPAFRDDAGSVKRAFETLRAADELRVRVAPGVRLESRPMVDGNEIVLAPHLIHGDELPQRYVNSVNIVTLLELAPRVSHVPDLYESYVKASQDVPLHDFLMALSTAVARGWLVSE